MKTKVFISWGGERGRQLGEILCWWFKAMVHNLEPFFSERDIQSGELWRHVLAAKLKETDVGVVVLTAENPRGTDFQLFEAGALAKGLDKARLIPILFDGLSEKDLREPLSAFQARQYHEKGMWRLIQSINDFLPPEEQVDPDVIKRTFEKFWPDLDAAVKEVKEPAEIAPPRNQVDILEEILNAVRRGNVIPGSSPSWSIPLDELERSVFGILTDPKPTVTAVTRLHIILKRLNDLETEIKKGIELIPRKVVGLA